MRVLNWVGGCLVGSLMVTTSAVAGATAEPPSRSVNIGVAKDVAGRLTAVSTLSATDAWAVGYAGSTLLTMHWNGVAWRKVKPPVPPDATSASFRGVAMIAADDVWAVGDYWIGHKSYTLLEHWAGAAWTIVPGPDVGLDPGLVSVSASSSGDVWAVGFHYPGGGIIHPLIEHWDGVAWTQVAEPRPPRNGAGDLSAVRAVSATEAWAAGRTIRADGLTDTLIARWNGNEWTRSHSPGRRGDFTDLEGMDTSGSSGWAAGSSYYAKPLLAHRDGSEWVRDPLPEGTGNNADLRGVSASGPVDAWVAGYARRGHREQPLTWHWNGRVWTPVRCPGVPDSNDNHLWAVSALTPSDAWVVGDYAKDGAVRVLIEHWDGATWTIY
jgi:hypothetical protein